MTSEAGDGLTYLAFDYGTQSIGVAVGQTITGLAQALSSVRVYRSGPDWNKISELVHEWHPAGLVVGLPLNSNNQQTASSLKAQKFGKELQLRYNIPINWINETLTTETARRLLHDQSSGRLSKHKIDNAAAALILQSFLDNHS